MLLVALSYSPGQLERPRQQVVIGKQVSRSVNRLKMGEGCVLS